MGFFETVLNAHWHVLGADILYREIVGNLFGLASAVGGMRRRIWAWPVGIVGNVLLFTVFLGGVFHTPQDTDLYGQAGRQVMFAAVSFFGWYRWNQARRPVLGPDGTEGAPATPPVHPHWAGVSGWVQIVAIGVGGTALFWWVFSQIGSFGPLADSWIFTGSFLATYGMARGWNEFWLIWVGVDVVGVPLLVRAGYYPSAILYGVYGLFVIGGFVVWLRTQRQETAEAAALAPETTKALTG